MSTSLLYHGFGIPTGYTHRSTKFNQGKIIFNVEESDQYLRCSNCSSRSVIKRGSRLREFRSPPIGLKPVVIALPVARLECKDCKLVRQAKIRFAESGKSYIRKFRRYVIELSRYMTIQAIADLLEVSWDLVRDIQEKYLKARYGRPNLRKLKMIAIDEVYMGKAMDYLTVVMDLERSIIVYVGEGKSGDALEPFWKQLKRAGVKLTACATDMGAAYVKSVRENQPEAVNVIDHFHVIKLFNEKLSKLRCDVQRDAETTEEKQFVKGIRWLLLTRSSKLEKKGEDAKERLNRALEVNVPLAKAYYLKEELALIWRQADKASAEQCMTEWIQKAEASNVTMLKRFAKTLTKFRSEILAYYDFDGLSSGPMEGMNNKIKTLNKMAYGYRNKEFLKLKILSLHESRKNAFAKPKEQVQAA